MVAAAVLSLVVTSCSKYRYEEVADDPLHSRIYTLDNGLKVYMTVNGEAPRIQTYIAVRVGSKNDPLETTGLAHYFEHLMFKGTESFGTQDYEAERPMLDEIERLFEVYRTTTDADERRAIYARIDSVSQEASKLAIPNEYDKLMSAIGAAGTNAFTSYDMTVYTEEIPSNQIDNWAKIQSDRFANAVIRGFHTELETVYEEYNMSLTSDSRKMLDSLMVALYPHHPYGMHTVLGTQEDLKNPSITNIKNYYKTYYVPNNMAICLSGDFDPDRMIATIDKYFGGLKPNPELPEWSFTPEPAMTAPVEKTVLGQEAEMIYLGWRTGGASSEDADMIQLVSSLLSNGKCGLLDVDIQQQQKMLGVGAEGLQLADYGMMVAIGYPKPGQTLEEARDMLLDEIGKLRAGDFDEELLASTIANYKRGEMQALEENGNRAMAYVDAFINGVDWKRSVEELDRLSKVTKADVVAWANEKLDPEVYAAVYKRQGVDPNIHKIDKPQITPIATNRDKSSEFLAAIQAAEVEAVQPVFVDYASDLSVGKMKQDIEVLYKQNTTNGLFSLYYVYDFGTTTDPAFGIASDYFDLLGTDTQSLQEIQREFYDLACSFGIHAGGERIYVTISGLAENMDKAVKLAEEYMQNVEGDDAVLAQLKANAMKARNDAKLNQNANFPRTATVYLLRPRSDSGADADRRAAHGAHVGRTAGADPEPERLRALRDVLRSRDGGEAHRRARRDPPHVAGVEAGAEGAFPAADGGQERGQRGAVRRQTDLLSPIFEPRREVLDRQRSGRDALQQLFRRRHVRRGLPGDARGAFAGLYRFRHLHRDARQGRSLYLLCLHRHAERQDAPGRRGVRRDHREHARIGEGLRTGQAGYPGQPLHAAHRARQRAVEFRLGARDGRRGRPQQGRLRRRAGHDARRREGFPRQMGQGAQIHV